MDRKKRTGQFVKNGGFVLRNLFIFGQMFLFGIASNAQSFVPVASPPPVELTPVKDMTASFDTSVVRKGAKGFLNVDGEVMLLRHARVFDVQSSISSEKRHWAVLFTPKPFKAKMSLVKDPRALLAGLKEYLYFEFQPYGQEIVFYQILHPNLKTVLTGQPLPSPQVQMKSQLENNQLTGIFGMKDFVGEKENRHLFWIEWKSEVFAIQMTPPLPQGEMPLGSQFVDHTLNSLPVLREPATPAQQKQ